MNVQNETLWMLGSRYKKQGRVWRDPSIEPSAAVCRFMFLESLAVRPSMVTVCSVQVVTTSSTYPTHPTDSYRFTASGLVGIEHGSQHALLISYTPGPSRVCLFGGPATCWNLYPEVAWLQSSFGLSLDFRMWTLRAENSQHLNLL